MSPSRGPREASSRQSNQFSRRERQIMDVIYRLGSATVSEIATRLPDPPTNTAVRTMLRILERKGHLRHRVDGLRNVYSPVVPAEQTNRSVLRQVVETFFQGSHARAMATLLELRAPLSDEELDRLGALIDRARKRR
jgi:BlaI family transcriptional regulator, penicillinase repressor